MSDYPKALQCKCVIDPREQDCGFPDCAGGWEVALDELATYIRTLPRWRPASEPVPQDEPGREVFAEFTDGTRSSHSAKFAEYERTRGVLTRWLWWDELDALLSRPEGGA